MAGTRRDLTAMARAEPSRPVRIAVEHGVLAKSRPFLDYGCGRGADVEWLSSMGWKARGWDPVHRPNVRRTRTETVSLTYVVNVIEDPVEREEVLRDAWRLAGRVLVVSARLEDERDDAHVRPRADGWMTSRGTFQRFFGHVELGEWIARVLGVDPVPAAPGVWYAFRKIVDREDFSSRRYMMRVPAPRQRKSDAAFVEHRALLQELIEFFARHGRLPVADEIAGAAAIRERFGSVRAAFRVVETVTDRGEWLLLAERRRIDVLVYLALRRFDGAFRMADLSPATQRDVRAHHRSLARATELADRLLFAVGSLDQVSIACRASSVGKLTPAALYVHVDALEHVPAVLKVYEGCARRIVGDVPGANIVKLHRDAKKVSYLAYPSFDDDPHPSLHRSDVVDLVEQDLHTRRYPQERNVPILHRKEEFLHKGDQRWEGFRLVTEREVAAGLHADPSRIGYRHQWDELIRQSNAGGSPASDSG